MSKQHVPNWIEASMMLRDAMERYRDKEQKASLSKVIDDLLFYIQENTGKWLDVKTIRRDIGNKSKSKKLYPIPNWRVEIYAKWFYEITCEDREWIAKWIEQTVYPSPGKLLTEVFDGDIQEVYTTVKSNVPPMNLWGNFLGRQEEIGKLQRWADHRRHPIAVLCGFGGNGKTTIQRKVGKEFVHGITCPLRWPYDGAIWVSALDYSRGQPNLCDVLRAVARTFELFDKELNLELIQPTVVKQEARELLEEKRVLVLLDNFETVSSTNQIEILEFFNDLEGLSQTLVSTRYRPDWFLEREQDEMYSMAHALIRVNGLSSEDAETLIQDFISTKSVPQDRFESQEIKRLTETTHNNPKSILAVLGLVEQGMSLSYLLDAIVAGKPEADCIFDKIIDEAWANILTDYDKAVLMAKALFSRSVSENDLGQVADVNGEHLTKTIKKLAAISFFEFEPTSKGTRRIRTHPLAQDFARHVLREYPEFEKEAEERWWREYAPNVIYKAEQIAYESISPELEEDVANVTEHVEKHIYDEQSFYRLQAAKMFARREGLGRTLIFWGRWDESLRIAKSVLNFGIEQQDSQIIGRSALHIISYVHYQRTEFDEANRYIGLTIDQNIRLNDQWLDATVERTRAELYRRRGYLGASKESHQKALQTFLALGNQYDIAGAYFRLGRVTVEIATKDLKEAIDKSGKANVGLIEAEKYFNESIHYLDKKKKDRGTQYIIDSNYFWKAVIARLRGEINQSRDLFQSCIGKFPSLLAVARIYREMALIEHLAANKELAYFYEDKGLNLEQQVGLIGKRRPHHSYRVIDRMKQEGTW